MGNKRSVLVIEDIEPVRECLCSVLKADGFETHGCEDGTAALAAAAKHDFHIIITDYRMPNMNGLDATRRLRRRLPAAIIIGVSSDDKREDFLAAGADAFLLKPYLYAEIKRLMDAGR